MPVPMQQRLDRAGRCLAANPSAAMRHQTGKTAPQSSNAASISNSSKTTCGYVRLSHFVPSGLSIVYRRKRLIGLSWPLVPGLLAWALAVVAAANESAGGDRDIAALLHQERRLAEYSALARRQAKNYDPAQDISPRQLLILLEVSQRTGANLGQALATGEFESAKTWNDFVRPTLGNGSLGSATGVWQFIPSTFHRIIEQYGSRLLAASSAKESLGLAPLDLSAGPFCDAQVRSIIQDTVDGLRGADDGQLQLLRHNFAVLAFAKHYLSVASGAKTPEEDYLFHFLGEGRGRQILALASGQARHTLSVRPLEPNLASGGTTGLALAGRQREGAELRRDAILSPASGKKTRSSPPGQEDFVVLDRTVPKAHLSPGSQRPSLEEIRARRIASKINRLPLRSLPAAATWSSPGLANPARASSAWGFPADSPVVTGNPGMFYRDGRNRTDPYTWAEFMRALAKRVQAKQQPAMVRAKYGVGFQMNGGDMPGWTMNTDRPAEAVEFRHAISGSLLVPQALITGPLTAAETHAYRKRLAELIRQGETSPLPPFSLVSALQHLGLLAPGDTEFAADSPALTEALHAFRTLVGKAEPDDPAYLDKLMPAERVALEIYDQRIARYAALQFAQQASMGQALDLMSIKRRLKRHQRASRPHIARLQQALAEHGLRTQTRRGKRTKAEHFDGIAGKLTQGSLDRFQLRNGLIQTHGLLDSVTVAMLGLPPMGQEIFWPPSGPQCPVEPEAEKAQHCETRLGPKHLSQRWSQARRRLIIEQMTLTPFHGCPARKLPPEFPLQDRPHVTPRAATGAAARRPPGHGLQHLQ